MTELEAFDSKLLVICVVDGDSDVLAGGSSTSEREPLSSSRHS